MTETQAQSGAVGASTNPVESEAGGGATEAAPAASAARTVGRATVPGDAPSAGTGQADDGATQVGDAGTAPVSGGPSGPGSGSLSGGATGAGAGSPSASSRPVSAAPVSAAPVSGSPVSGASGLSRGGIGATAQPGAARTVTGRAGVPGASQGVPSAARTQAIRPTGMTPPPSTVGLPPGGGSKVSEAMRTARAAVSGAAPRGPRRARLFVKRVDPWSVMKFSFAVSLVLFLVAIIATMVLYLALDAMGVFDSINKTLSGVVGATGSSGGFKITAKGVLFAAALLGGVNVVLFTAMSTLGAFIYNVSADLVGGVEVTLSEKE